VVGWFQLALPLSGEVRLRCGAGIRFRAGPPGSRSHLAHTNMWDEASWQQPAATSRAKAREGRNACCRKVGLRRTTHGPDQGERHTQHRQCGGNTPAWAGDKEGDPRRHNSGHRRPQTGDEHDAGERSDHVRRPNRGCGCCDPGSTADQRRPATAASECPAPGQSSAKVENHKKPFSPYAKSQRLERIATSKRLTLLLGFAVPMIPRLRPI
jgi:hypothetical protein